MKTYGTSISLVRNGRGVYCLDTTMGCASGMSENPRGCYGDCYAYRTSRVYGYDFKQTVLRDFESVNHKNEILRQVQTIQLPFVRIGCSGDPSENWEHSIKIIKQVSAALQSQYKLFRKWKDVVIITRHWNILKDSQLIELQKCGNIIVNTSISAIDDPLSFGRALNQYERLKPFVKSILRVVSMDFNKDHPDGNEYAKIQEVLFKHNLVIDTVFRPSKNNPLIRDGVIHVKKSKFLGKPTLVSKVNRKTYVGFCGHCKEMCGSTM